MAPPFTYRTVVGTYTAPDGTAVAGSLRFVPSTAIYDLDGNVVVPALPITVVLDAYGDFSVDLLVTDDPLTSPSGWVWRVTELFSPQREWEFQLSTSASSPTAIADLTPVTTVDVTYAYASLATVLALDGRVDAAEATVSAAAAAAASAAADAADSAADAASAAADAADSAADAASAAAIADDLQTYLMMGAM
jgi:hypothetical protein